MNPSKKHRTRLLTGAIIPAPSNTPFVTDTIKWSVASKPVAPPLRAVPGRFGVGKHARKSRGFVVVSDEGENGLSEEDEDPFEPLRARGKVADGAFRTFLDTGACLTAWGG